jgi:peptide chain release factor 1
MIRQNILKKLSAMEQDYQTLEKDLADPDIVKDQKRYQSLMKTFSDLEPLVQDYRHYCQLIANHQETLSSQQADQDPEWQACVAEELADLNQQIEDYSDRIKRQLIPKDPDDNRNVFLEIRAGAGGDEASLFVSDLSRMYQRYAERNRWSKEIINTHEASQGGYKSIILKINGKDVYMKLKFESGTHRVQRIPTTESNGRIHTSTCTVAVLPEVESIDHIDINPSDLRIDTFRSSGAGGQHVNTTDSAVRITHLPTNVVVECQDERSQHKNKAKAMSVLQAKILSSQRDAQQQQQASTRKQLVGRGDRSERIRTYNYPQGRITDHRIQLTSHHFTGILDGELTSLIDALTQAYQADQMTQMPNDAD